MKMKLNVQAIFKSIDGEVNGFDGAGQLSIFIRLKGCNLKCKYCDTTYANNFEPANWMTIDEVVDLVFSSGTKPKIKKITITGGEPSLQGDALVPLIKKLLFLGYLITVETNGSLMPISQFLFIRPVMRDVRFVVDFKLPSSGMTKYMNSLAFSNLRKIDVIKFVISDEEDYNYAKMLIQEHSNWIAKKVFSPALDNLNYQYNCNGVAIEGASYFEMAWPRQLAEMMIRDKVDAQFSLQIHKVLWPRAKEER